MKAFVCSCLLVVLALTPALAQAPVAVPTDLRLVLPEEIPAVPGRECNIYFDNIILSSLPWQNYYQVEVTCLRGKQMEERWTWTPTTEAQDQGIIGLTLRFTDPQGQVVAEGQTKIRVYPAEAGADQPLTALIVGDSLTSAMVYTDELYKLMEQPGNPKLTLIGSNAPYKDRPEIRNEGYGGWTAKRFVTLWGDEPLTAEGRRNRSPFLFEQDGQAVFNFQQYCDEHNGGQGPDVITIFLGCNDNFSAKDDTIEERVDDFITHMDLLINEFHRVRADTKIALIALPPPTASQDAFGDNYGCYQTRWQYRKNQHRVVERMMEKYGHREAEHLFVVPAHLNLDCVYNYPVKEGPANARADGPGATIVRQNNSVHPAASGYRQIADLLYCGFKGLVAQ